MLVRTLFTCCAAVLTVALLATADHGSGCVPGHADPATINHILLPDGTLFYVEERNVPPPFNTAPPVPGSGFLLRGEGTWIYEETNGLPGLQRGAISDPGCIPFQDPCLILWGVDPVGDATCGHRRDTLVF